VKGAYNTIKYCVIGEDARWGIRVAGSAAVNNLIRNNIIDSKEGVYKQDSVDGIALANSSTYTRVYQNLFGAWDHTAVEFERSDYNEVYNNTAINPDGINTRFFGLDLGSDYNKIHHNWAADMDCRSQFGAGVHNEVYKNIFYRMTNGPEDEGNAVLFQGIAGGASKYNKFYNNIIYHVQKQAVAFYNNPDNGDVQHNQVYKNVIVNTGLEGYPIIWVDDNENGILNQEITDNIIFNENGVDYIKHRGSKITTAEFNQNDGYDTVDNNKWQDPKFKDPENGDFTFMADSPLINEGIEQVHVQVLKKSDLLKSGVTQLMPPILRIAQTD
jgi:hypothetical protein